MKQHTKNVLSLAFRMAVLATAITAFTNMDSTPAPQATAAAAVTAPAMAK
ncbi:MAG: hypothetical protein PW788_10485 [Micavibrio sp.]|nr:hypothetical protein [Micavibrio sp.]